MRLVNVTENIDEKLSDYAGESEQDSKIDHDALARYGWLIFHNSLI